jgi:hypothetical protein
MNIYLNYLPKIEKDVTCNKLIYFVCSNNRVKSANSTEAAIPSFFGHMEGMIDGGINSPQIFFDLMLAWNLTGKTNFLWHRRQFIPITLKTCTWNKPE